MCALCCVWTINLLALKLLSFSFSRLRSPALIIGHLLHLISHLISTNQRASLTPEQEAKRYLMQRQMQDLDEAIQAKTEEKRRMDKEIEGLMSQKRR